MLSYLIQSHSTIFQLPLCHSTNRVMKCKFVLSIPSRHQLSLWGALGYTATSVSANSLISLRWLEFVLIPVKTSCVLRWTQNRSPSKQENLELHLYWIDHACFYWRVRSLLCRTSLKRTIIFFFYKLTREYSKCNIDRVTLSFILLNIPAMMDDRNLWSETLSKVNFLLKMIT